MQIVGLLTDEPQVLETARHYIGWAWLVPAAGCMAFIWDGVFVGLTATRGMLLSSFLAAATFFGICGLAAEAMGNHGLWLAQIVYLAVRGMVQSVWYQRRITPAIP